MIITSEKVDSLPGKANQITGDQHEEPVVLTDPKFSFKELQPWQIMSLWMAVHQGWVILMYYWSPGWGKSRGKELEWHFSFYITTEDSEQLFGVWLEPCISLAALLSIPPTSDVGLGCELQSSVTGILQRKNIRHKSLIFPNNQCFPFPPRHLFLSYSVVKARKWHIHSSLP